MTLQLSTTPLPETDSTDIMGRIVVLRKLSHTWHMVTVLTRVHATVSTRRAAGKLAVRVIASLRPTHTHIRYYQQHCYLLLLHGPCSRAVFTGNVDRRT